MRLTLDIPEETHARLKARAKEEGTIMRQIVLRCIGKELDGEVHRKVDRLTQPILKSYAPGSIRLNNEQIYDLIGFP